MSQEGKNFICKLCEKEITVTKEGKNPAPPTCCGQEMNEKE